MELRGVMILTKADMRIMSDDVVEDALSASLQWLQRHNPYYTSAQPCRTAEIQSAVDRGLGRELKPEVRQSKRQLVTESEAMTSGSRPNHDQDLGTVQGDGIPSWGNDFMTTSGDNVRSGVTDENAYSTLK